MSTAHKDWRRLRRQRQREQAVQERARRAQERRREQAEQDARRRAAAEAERREREAERRRLDARRRAYGRRAEETFVPTPVAGKHERRMARAYARWAQSRATGRPNAPDADISLETWLEHVANEERAHRRPWQVLLWWFVQLPLVYGGVMIPFLVALRMAEGDGTGSIIGALVGLVLLIPAGLLVLAAPILPFLAFMEDFTDEQDGLALLRSRPLPSQRVMADRTAYAEWVAETRRARADNDRRLQELGIDA